MIINKDIHPERKIYYLGASVIDMLRVSTSPEIKYLDLYHRLNIVKPISIEAFSMTLDWLFILGVIDVQQGGIKKCF